MGKIVVFVGVWVNIGIGEYVEFFLIIVIGSIDGEKNGLGDDVVNEVENKCYL